MDAVKDYYNKIYDYRKDLRIDWKRMNRWLENANKRVWLWRSSMIDIGCGTGRTYFWAQQRNLLWLGIDNNLTACLRARLNIGNGPRIGHCNAEDLLYPSNSFDLAVALGSIEHMDHPFVALKEMHRVLKPNGLAVILVPNRIALLEWLGLYHGTEQPQELMLSKRDWKTMILNAGFTVHRTRKDYGPAIFKNWKPHKIIQRASLKLSYILPDAFAYCWIFDCSKDA